MASATNGSGMVDAALIRERGRIPRKPLTSLKPSRTTETPVTRKALKTRNFTPRLFVCSTDDFR
jgi:hypothetical protein